MPRTKNTPKVFWSKVAILSDENACWIWASGVFSSGYGRIKWNGRDELTHRIAYELHFGVDPANLDVLHKCDTPLCCNPNHLFLGTQQDNMRDMKLKGRAARNSGEHAGNCKLSDNEVEQIRAKYVRRRITQKMLGLEYGVTASQISNIIRGNQRT